MLAATSLAEQEKRLGVPTYKTYGMIGGTSVGSIIGAPLACGIPSEVVVNFFRVSAPNIFKGSLWRDMFRLRAAAKYPPQPLQDALTQMLGSRTLADCKTNCIFPAVDMITGLPVYFQSYGKSLRNETEIIVGPDSKTLLVDVCLASSAAQSYFPGHKVGDLLCWDGGSSGFNAPDNLIISELEELNPLESISMVSLGAGETNWKYADCDMTNPSIARVLEATLAIAYGTPEITACWMARKRLGDRYVRLNPFVYDSAIDDASEDNLNALVSAAMVIP